MIKFKKTAILLSTIFISNISYSAPTASAKAFVLTHQTAKIMMPIQLNSHHEVTITNDQDGMQMFYFKFTLCPVDQMRRCAIMTDKLGLAKGQHYTFSRDLITSVAFQVAGDHNVIATTEVTGAATIIASQSVQIPVLY